MHVGAVECRVELARGLVRFALVQIVVVPRPGRPLEVALVVVRR
jgi:hypothetical protein